jgi:prepilin-type N-terminal cleavage/methylation domain-containing protein
MKKTATKGFTLIEVLVVIGIIAILAAIVVIAINPARQFAQANNSQRWSNVNAILNSVHQYSVDNKGQLPPALANATSTKPVCLSSDDAVCTGNGYINLATSTVPTYIVSIPKDPTQTSTTNSGYTVGTSSGNRVVVSAPSAENSESISVTR